MITRDQFYNLMALHQRGDNWFSKLPKEMITEIYKAKPSRNSNISKALDFAADAEQEAVNQLLRMLDQDPSLVLQAGNVVNRGGNTIIGVTPYEFALGEGDPELAAKIAPYFDKISGGEAERERQYNHYKPHIDAMKSQAPYDLNPLINIIQKSSPADITEALNKNFDPESELNAALKQFREDHAQRVIRKPCIHYNHKTLERAFNLLHNQWTALSSNETNYDKCCLVWRQIIGFLQLTLPAIDRMVFARAFQDSTRSLNFLWDEDNHFRDAPGRGRRRARGVGFDSFIYGCVMSGVTAAYLRPWNDVARSIKIHVEQKLQTYRTYAAAPNSDDRLCDTGSKSGTSFMM